MGLREYRDTNDLSMNSPISLKYDKHIANGDGWVTTKTIMR